MSSKFSAEQREEIMATARAHLAARDDFTPRPVDLLSDMADVVRAAREPEPEPPATETELPQWEQQRLVTRSLDDEFLQIVVDEVRQLVADHLADHLNEVVAELVRASVEFVNKQVEGVRVELTTKIERLSAEVAITRTQIERMRGELAMARAQLERSAATFDTSNNGFAAVKH